YRRASEGECPSRFMARDDLSSARRNGLEAGGGRNGPGSLLRRIISPDRLAARPREEPALVGREAELSTLAHLLDETRSGSGRAVVIEGESGIGKTRLTREIVQRATAAGFTHLQGSGEELQADRPFGVG